MKNLPNGDENLVNFLRQNRPEVPPETPDLSEKIFKAIESSSPLDNHHYSQKNPVFRHRQLWLVPPAIAASLALAWTGNYWRETASNYNSLKAANSISKITSFNSKQLVNYQNKTLPQDFISSNTSNNQELGHLESFLENNWNSTLTTSHPEMSVDDIQYEYLKLANSKASYPTKTTSLATTRR